MLLAYNENTFRASEERIAVVSTRVFRRVIDAPSIESHTALEDVMRQGFLTTDRNGQSFRVMTVDAAHAWGFGE